MFVVERKQLQTIYNSAIKLIGKFAEIIVDVQKDGLWLIINVESFIKVFVPAEVEETGIFKIQQEVFEPVFSLRGEKLKCSFNKEQNILNVTAGTKTSLYVDFKVSKEDYEEPDFGESSQGIKLKSKDIGTFKQNLHLVHFNSPDLNTHEYALVQNTPSDVIITFASTNMCARYKFKDNLGKQEFELTIPINKLKLALAMIESEASLTVVDNFLVVRSDNLVVTLPALIDTQFLGFIESCDALLADNTIVKGELHLVTTEIQKTLGSVRSISQGSNTVDFKIKDKTMIITLENKIGVTKDKIEIPKNTIGKEIKFTIPELFVDAALSMSQYFGKDIIMRFGEGYRFFIISIKNEDVDFFVLGPMSEE